jgi:hypothetical protein
MRKTIFSALLALAIGFTYGWQQAGAATQSAGRISVSPNATLQRCIGTVPGQPRPQKIGPSPATMNYCRQLPGWELYEQAGQRFQAGDHPGAAKLLLASAKAGNPIASAAGDVV